jgi:hypothetical protein
MMAITFSLEENNTRKNSILPKQKQNPVDDDRPDIDHRIGAQGSDIKSII